MMEGLFTYVIFRRVLIDLRFSSKIQDTFVHNAAVAHDVIFYVLPALSSAANGNTSSTRAVPKTRKPLHARPELQEGVMESVHQRRCRLLRGKAQDGRRERRMKTPRMLCERGEERQR